MTNNKSAFYSFKGDTYNHFGFMGSKGIKKAFFSGKISLIATFAFFIVFLFSAVGLNADPAKASTELKGEVVGDNRVNLEIIQGDGKEYTVNVKNSGTRAWGSGEITLETGPFLRSNSEFRHEDWRRYFQPTYVDKRVAPGETVSLTIPLQAPADISGLVQEQFQLVFNNRPIPGTEVNLFVNVVEGSSGKEEAGDVKEVKNTPKSDTPETTEESRDSEDSPDFCISLTQKEREQYERCRTDSFEEETPGKIEKETDFDKEPTIRVGLFKADSSQRVRSNIHFDIYAGDKILFSGLSPEIIPTISYKNDKYVINLRGITKTSDKPLRLVPRNKAGVIELVDHADRPSWNPSINYNKFRNSIEFNYSRQKQELWVINELPISSYIKGLAETTDYSPAGFQKVIATAARTYAMYHYNRGVEFGLENASTKHSEEGFHVDAIYDQVYKGYASEKQLPQYSRSVEDTKGMVITYDGKVVVTPYFSQSDGRTRSWEEVWYGDGKPWLKSVPVPQEEGEEMWGHGVGLSARGALKMIRDGRYEWKEALKYFYQNTELKKIYN
jgi:hypothetical protein